VFEAKHLRGNSMLPEATFHQCPNPTCTNSESGTVVLQCRHCGARFCYKLGVYQVTGCGHDGHCPSCGATIERAHRLGHILNEHGLPAYRPDEAEAYVAPRREGDYSSQPDSETGDPQAARLTLTRYAQAVCQLA
jgi:hypothetical protein